MADSITSFFAAWQVTSNDERLSTLTTAVSPDIRYDDPRTPQTIQGIDALNEYLGMFSANAPGWSARVIGRDVTAGMTRATVAFGGPGPDGKDMVQLGQYFIESDGEQIIRMVGFVGTGQADQKTD